MTNAIKLSNPLCPVCKGNSTTMFIKTEDHFLSKEDYSIYKCEDCELLFTWPQPPEQKISDYYHSKEYYSHKQTGYSLTGYIYRIARNFVRNRKVKIIHNRIKNGFIIDIGCGTGEFLAGCKRKGYITMGIEPNPIAREFAITQHGLNVYNTDHLKQCPLNSVEIITLWHSLEHTYDPLDYFKELSRIIKPGGLLLIALPNLQSWDAYHYGQFWAAWDTPRHLYHFSQRAIERLAAKFDFSLDEVLPLTLDAYYVSLLSEKYMKTTLPHFKAIIQGWKSNRKAKTGKFAFSSQIYLFSRK